VKQHTNSHDNFEGIDDLMCNSYKIISLLHKLPLNGAAAKMAFLLNTFFYAVSSVFNYLSSLFNVCLMHGKKLPRIACKLSLYLFVITRVGT